MLDQGMAASLDSTDPQGWVLPAVLLDQAERLADTPWVTMTTGESMTFAQAALDMRRVAGFLADLGIGPGDRVVVLLHSSCDFIRLWLGLGAIGAVAVLLNTQLRGAFLRHQIASARASLIVVESSLMGALAAALPEGSLLPRIVEVNPGLEGVGDRIAAIDWTAWGQARPYDGAVPKGHDLACIMFTSGTSGPAKGVLMPHAHCTLFGLGIADALQLGPDDRYYISLPLFHANGLLMQLGSSLLAGIPAVIRPRFSASQWLDDVRTHGSTVTHLLGALSAFVLQQSASVDDRHHQLRALLNAPNLAEHEAAFRERFGVRDVISGFGMTEVNNPILGRVGHSCPGASGRVRSEHFDVVVADPDTDLPVPPGMRGEILVRPKVPFGFMAGYHDLPDKTAEAWRNLWFHTGDAGVMDVHGVVTFIDRIKDCIRRRGENIAANEVEAAIAAIPGVQEVAAFAVPSGIAGGEDEVMLAIVPMPGVELSVQELALQADAALPRFARPRFLELMAELPKTGTGKVQRAALRVRGSASAYDRDAVQNSTQLRR